MILAGISNAGAYVTPFVKNETQQVLRKMLAGVWDFNSDASQKKSTDDPATWVTDPSGYIVVPKDVPRRIYYQNTVGGFDYGNGATLIQADIDRWHDYQPTAGEIPPLPPLASNSAVGGDQGDKNPDQIGSFIYAHHLIRDFLFLDAARSDDLAQGGADNVVPVGSRQFRAIPNQTVLQPVLAAPLNRYTRGVGAHAYNKLLLATSAVDVPNHAKRFSFAPNSPVGHTSLLYELDGEGAGNVGPNWFGVVVPAGQVNFSSVIIYFHPTPGQARYYDDDYQKKATQAGYIDGGGNRHADWKELFGYVDRLGGQMAGAIKDNPDCSQVVIIPFMRGVDAGNAGIMPGQWYFIVSDILGHVMLLKAQGFV